MNILNPLQTNTPDRTPKRHRHSLKLRCLDVARVEKLSRSMIRVILSGPELEGFVSLGFDDHIKIFFPAPGETKPNLPILGPQGIEFPEGVPRPVARDFTPRSFDAAKGELAIDFATNHEGPASHWARAVKVGDPAWIGGPRGSITIPLAFDWYLLIADESGLPALARRLEELPPSTRALAFITVDAQADRLALSTEADASITWLTRDVANGAETEALISALRSCEMPQGDFFSWVACESSMAKAVRGVLVDERGANPKWTRASGYWRRGASGVHDHFEE